MKLVFSEDCPYCRTAEAAITRLDVFGHIESVPIESDEGRELVEGHHDRYVHAPHLFTDEVVYYGIAPTAKGLVKEYVRAVLSK